MKRELRDNRFHWGNVGETTPFEVNGQYLQVGDVVYIYDENNNYDTHFVCKDDEKYFIMGIKCCCNNKTGIIEGWKVKLIKKHHEVRDDEKYDNVRMINLEPKTLKDYTNNELLNEISKRTNIFVNLLHTDDEINIYTLKVEH